MLENEFLWFFVVLALAFIFPFIKKYRFKQSSWTGTITNKEYRPERDDYTYDSDGHKTIETIPEAFILHYETTSGKKRKLEVTAEEYEQFSIGDVVEKKQGQKKIMKV